MLRHTIGTFFATAASVAVLASCSSPQETSPPAESQTNPAQEAGKGDPSLAIENPKDLKKVAEDPCSLLTPEQLTDLGGAGEGKVEDTVYGTKLCRWSGDKFAVSITPDTTLGRDAKRMYQDAEKHGNPERFRIGGYPAANNDTQEVMSTVEVAVAEDQSISVAYTKHSGGTPEMDDPFGYSKKIAETILQNIPDAQPK